MKDIISWSQWVNCMGMMWYVNTYRIFTKTSQDIKGEINNNTLPYHGPVMPYGIRLTLYVLSCSEGFLHVDMAQVVEIILQVRQGPTYSTWRISLLLMTWRWARASATMIFTMLNRIDLVPARWGLTLVQLMAHCLMIPSHYLNQC